MAVLTHLEINILLVDDRRENLLALEAALQPLNYNLMYAGSGEEALKLVLQHDFAAVLLDVQMPGLSGFETARLIKARERSEHIPIIFITAISQAEKYVLQGYSAGAIDYLFKPFHPESLRMKVESLVSLYRQREQLKLHSQLLSKRTRELEEANEKLLETSMILRKAETLNRVIIDTSIDTILTFDPTGTMLTVNLAAEAMFGYTKKSMIGRNVAELFPDSGGFDSPFAVVSGMVSRGSKIIETSLRRSDGSIFPVDIQLGEALIDGQRLYVCFIRDITERKQLEEERKDRYRRLEQLITERTKELLQTNNKLHMSQERFRKIFEASPSLIGIRSLEDGHYIDVNESWLHYSGYGYDEILAHREDVMQFWTLDAEGRQVRLKELEKRNVRNTKTTYTTKSGLMREGLVSTEVIEIQGKPCELIVVTDITDRLHLEKEMARLDRLNLIGEMAAGIAHEIRNPMTTVKGFLQIIRSKQIAEFSTHIDLMLTELDRANDIITEFLTLAKTKMTHQKQQSLNDIIQALHPLIQAEALLFGKQIVMELRSCPPLLLDEKEVRQLILNIVLNGLEAMQSGGILTISTFVENNEVVMSISDQGGGIKEEWLDKLGTPFFTTKETGTGLGLAVCYSVAARHNAVIDVKTGPEGTTFYVRFPLPAV